MSKEQPPKKIVSGERKEYQFDLKAFGAELEQIGDEYSIASDKYPATYVDGKAVEDARVTELYDKLLEICASSLIQTNGDQMTMDTINNKCLHKGRDQRHGERFPLLAEANFLRKLVLKVAEGQAKK